MNRMSCRLNLILCGLLVASAACNAVPDLPDSVDVATTNIDRSNAPADTGPSSLADSSWSLARVADPDNPDDEEAEAAPPGPYGGILSGDALARPPVGERIFVVRFGPNGEMVEVTENRFFLTEVYGMTVPVGGEWSSAAIPGIFFRSASFGVQAGDRFGIAVQVQVRFGDVFLGRAILYAWGTVAGDMLTGQFGYLLDFTDGAAPFLGTIADQYPVEGQRLAE